MEICQEKKVKIGYQKLIIDKAKWNKEIDYLEFLSGTRPTIIEQTDNLGRGWKILDETDWANGCELARNKGDKKWRKKPKMWKSIKYMEKPC